MTGRHPGDAPAMTAAMRRAVDLTSGPVLADMLAVTVRGDVSGVTVRAAEDLGSPVAVLTIERGGDSLILDRSQARVMAAALLRLAEEEEGAA